MVPGLFLAFTCCIDTRSQAAKCRRSIVFPSGGGSGGRGLEESWHLAEESKTATAADEAAAHIIIGTQDDGRATTLRNGTSKVVAPQSCRRESPAPGNRGRAFQRRAALSIGGAKPNGSSPLTACEQSARRVPQLLGQQNSNQVSCHGSIFPAARSQHEL